MKNQNTGKKPWDNYAHYSGIAGQMLVIILLGVWGGIKLDQWLNMDFPVFVLAGSCASVAFAIYYVIKDL